MNEQVNSLLNGRRDLVLLREEACLDETETATVDRGIAAIDRLLCDSSAAAASPIASNIAP